MGIDVDCPPAAFPAMADQVAILMNVLKASFKVLQKAFVPLGPTISGNKYQIYLTSCNTNMIFCWGHCYMLYHHLLC